MSFRLPGELALSRQWIETRDKRPRYEGWTQPENWKLYTGIKGDRGFVLGDRFVVLDFDHVLDENGEWVNEEARRFYTELISQFPTWVEFSLSGTGLHVWYQGVTDGSWTKVVWDNEKKIGLDVFSGGNRHVVVTGNDFVVNKIRSTHGLFEWLEKKVPKKKSVKMSRPPKDTDKPWFTSVTQKRDVAKCLEELECSELDYIEWLEVSSLLKQMGMHDEWDEWCQTDPDDYNVRENERTWSALGYIAKYSPCRYLQKLKKELVSAIKERRL